MCITLGMLIGIVLSKLFDLSFIANYWLSVSMVTLTVMLWVMTNQASGVIADISKLPCIYAPSNAAPFYQYGLEQTEWIMGAVVTYVFFIVATIITFILELCDLKWQWGWWFTLVKIILLIGFFSWGIWFIIKINQAAQNLSAWVELRRKG